MSYEAYRKVLVYLIQALKEEARKRPAQAGVFRVFHKMTLDFLSETLPPQDGYALRNMLKDGLGRMVTLLPSEENWAVTYELCRDMLGMLDVPYAER